MKKPKPKKKSKKEQRIQTRHGEPFKKQKKQPTERDHEFNPEDVARLNND